jgi:regulator of replication initiation timing
LQQQVKYLKQQNTDMMTQNNILKGRIQNLKELAERPQAAPVSS